MADSSQRAWNPFMNSGALISESGARKSVPPTSGTLYEEALALERLNLRRAQLALPAVSRSSPIDAAARGHSTYLALNNTTGHYQSASGAGFTGVSVGDRVRAAGYDWRRVYEVIASGPSSGAAAIDNLVEAIYHRFGLFAADVNDVGIGMVDTHPYYGHVLTANLASNQSPLPSQSSDWLGLYPYPGQADVPRDFFSDEESPDPVAEGNQVGYPLSVHAASTHTLTTSSFTLSDASGRSLSGKLLTAATDSHTPASVAAFIPLSPLEYGTTYTARFSGSASGTPLDRSWSFTTAPLTDIRFCPANPTAGTGISFNVELSGGSGRYSGVSWRQSGSAISDVDFLGSTTLVVTTGGSGTATLTVRDSDGRENSTTLTVQSGAGTPDTSSCAAAAPTQATYSASVSGDTSAQTIELTLTPASSDVGQTRQVFVAAFAGTQIFFNNGASWLPWNGDAATAPPWAATALPAALTVPIVSHFDVRGLCGVDLVIGYGTSLAELVTAGRYRLVHRVCS